MLFFFLFPNISFIHSRTTTPHTHTYILAFFYLSLSSSFHTRSYKVTTPSPHLASFSILSPLVALFFLIAIIIYAFFSPPLLVVVVVVVTLYTRLFFFSLLDISPVSSQSHTSCFFFIIIGHVFLFFVQWPTLHPPTHLPPPRQFSFIKKKPLPWRRFDFFFSFFFFLI